MTINAEQAVAAARQYGGDTTKAFVGALGDKGFVVEFEDTEQTDPFGNLNIFVDAQTGEARSIPAQEYVEISDHLTPIQVAG